MTTMDAGVLADEQALNARYIAHLEERAANPVVAAAYSSSARTAPPPAAGRRVEIAPFLGRVAFDGPLPALGADSFYVGTWRWSRDGVDVVSWAAPKARCWFEPQQVSEGPAVVALRAFTPRGDRIVGYADERLGDVAGPTALDRRRALSVAAPPRRAARPARPTAPAAPAPVPQRSSPLPVTPAPAQRRVVDEPRRVRTATVPPPRRFAAALTQALEAPRRDGLRHVLTTLQPDQYRLVTHAPEAPLFIQGHPGSGKTIVATHRAAYLVDEARGGAGTHRPRVLLVGPTRRFVEHARGVLTSLGAADAVDVVSMEGLLARAAGVTPPTQELAVTGDTLLHHDEELGWYVEGVGRCFFGTAPPTGAGGAVARRRRLYEALAAHLALVPYRDRRELAQHVRALPTWSVARTERRHLPLLAHCALVADGEVTTELRYDHVIVDEAQDVPPLEWRFLARLNVGGGWTLVGDLNQRRCDWSFSSWQLVAEAIGVDTPDVRRFGTAYRSTKAVLAFANKLLPAKERAVTSVRTVGQRPEVVRVGKGQDIGATTVDTAVRLAERYRDGSTAVITPNSRRLAAAAVARGFQQRRPGDPWWRGRVELHLLDPEEARGLEFDAVVVMEPADFPVQLGRHGVLFTALTRANKELAVVHHKPLPDPLRRR